MARRKKRRISKPKCVIDWLRNPRDGLWRAFMTNSKTWKTVNSRAYAVLPIRSDQKRIEKKLLKKCKKKK